MAFRLKLKTRTEDVKQDFCEKCGEFGHTFRDCGMGITCYKCGKTGHHGRNCTEDIRYESVAVQSAKEQGIYAKGDDFYDKKRNLSGDWDKAAARDNQADEDVARPKDRTEADFLDRVNKTYTLLPSDEKDAARLKDEAKQRKREEREAQAQRDAELIAAYHAKLAKKKDKKGKKDKKDKKDKKASKKRRRGASESEGSDSDVESVSEEKKRKKKDKKEKKDKKASKKHRRDESESDVSESDDGASVSSVSSSVSNSEASERRRKEKKSKKEKKDKKERKRARSTSVSDASDATGRKRRRSEKSASPTCDDDVAQPSAKKAKTEEAEGQLCGSCGATGPAGCQFCPGCGRPYDQSDAAREAREAQRTKEREAKRQEELRRKAEAARAEHDAAEAKKRAHLERVMQSKVKRQGPYFTAPSWAEPRTDKRLYLSVERGGRVIEALDVSEHPYYLLGKNADVVDFPMEHESISRVHVAIIHDAEKNTTYVEDLNSKWGVKLDGRKVTKNSLVRFDVGSAMQVGGSSRLFCLKERSVWE